MNQDKESADAWITRLLRRRAVQLAAAGIDPWIYYRVAHGTSSGWKYSP